MIATRLNRTISLLREKNKEAGELASQGYQKYRWLFVIPLKQEFQITYEFPFLFRSLTGIILPSEFTWDRFRHSWGRISYDTSEETCTTSCKPPHQKQNDYHLNLTLQTVNSLVLKFTFLLQGLHVWRTFAFSVFRIENMAVRQWNRISRLIRSTIYLGGYFCGFNSINNSRHIII